MKLPSGRELEITLADFATSKALYMALADEARHLKIAAETDLDVNLIKDALCAALASPTIEKALHKCMGRVTIDKLKVDVVTTFEAEEFRGDYFVVCFEVAKANLLPFTKSLSAKLDLLSERLKGALVSASKTTPSSTTG